MGNKKRSSNRANSNRKEKTLRLSFAIQILAGLVLVTPLIGSLLPNIQPFYSKVVVMQLLIEAMAALWLILIIAHPRYRPNLRHPITLGALAVMATMLISLPFALDPAYSFWSRPGRMTGVVNYLHYYAWLLILLSTIRTPSAFRKLLFVSSGTSIAASLFGFYIWYVKSGKTVYSTLDNPSFFGAYMLMHVFVGAYLFVSVKSRAAKLFSMATMVIGTVSVFASGSRGAVLALVFGFFMTFMALFLRSDQSRLRKAGLVAAISAAVLVFVGVAIFLRSPQMEQWTSDNLSRPVERLLLKNFGQDRWQLWEYAVRGFAERPIFGWGMEQYELSFYKYYDPTDVDVVVLNERFADRVHNQYLDSLIASGIVGLVGYLALLFGAIYAAWKVFTKADDKTLRTKIAFVGGAIIAYCAYSFIMFDTPAALLVTLLIFALAGAHYRALFYGSELNTGKSPVKINGLIMPIIVVFVGIAMMVTILPFRKYWQVKDATAHVGQSRTQALEKFKVAYSGYNPFLHDLRVKGMESLIIWSENVSLVSNPMRDLLEFHAAELSKSAAERDYNSRVKLATAAVYRMLADYDKNALERAEKYAGQVLEKNPNRFGAHFEMAEINLARRQPDKAISNIRKAIKRVPVMNVHTHSYMHFRMASAYAMKCDSQKAKDVFEKAKEMGYVHFKDSRLVLDVANSCGFDSDFAWLENHLDKLLKIYPDHPAILDAAARIYTAAGSERKSEMAIEILGQRKPAAAERLRAEINDYKNSSAAINSRNN